MISLRAKSNAGFTLVELIVGMTLSLMIMGAVLSSYTFLARSFARSLGISSATEPNLEAQERRTLAYFTQDVRMASGLDTATSPYLTPNENTMTLILPTASGTNKIIYYFNDTATEVPVSSSIVPPHSLVRIDETVPINPMVLHNNLLTCAFTYYDRAGRPYTALEASATGFSSLSGIKQISLVFTSQGGNKTNGTQTQIFSSASPRLMLRNRQLLP